MNSKTFLLLLVLFPRMAIAIESFPIAITIDDLPAAGGAPVGESRKDVSTRIIETLKKHHTGSVYGFVNGSVTVNMSERAEVLKQWKDAGHKVGNHTFSHFDLGKVSATDYMRDIEKNESTLIDYADTIHELKVFRYPFLSEGDTVDKRYAVRSYLAGRNYRIAQVSVDFYDWDWIDAYTRCVNKKQTKDLTKLKDLYLREAREQLLYSLRMKKMIYGPQKQFVYILLLHYSQATSIYLDDLLTAYEKQGAKWVTLDDAFNSKSYDEDTGFVDEDGEPYLIQAAKSRKLNTRSIYQPESQEKLLNGYCL